MFQEQASFIRQVLACQMLLSIYKHIKQNKLQRLPRLLTLYVYVLQFSDINFPFLTK
jgi:hypothetical protein